MPTFVSKNGEWYPAKEKIGLTNKSDKPITYNGTVINPGEPFIYEGPDREALVALHKSGKKNANNELVLGTNFKMHPEFLQAVRNMSFNSVDDYLKIIGYNEEESEKEFESKAEKVKSHEVPKRVNEINVLGGGKDLSGNKENDLIGGYGEQRTRKPSEIKKTTKAKA